MLWLVPVVGDQVQVPGGVQLEDAHGVAGAWRVPEGQRAVRLLACGREVPVPVTECGIPVPVPKNW